MITKAALFEQLLMSSSCEMIFLTRATNNVLDVCIVDGSGEWFEGCSSEGISGGQKGRVDIRGRDTVPVISLEGAIGVLL